MTLNLSIFAGVKAGSSAYGRFNLYPNFQKE